MAAKHQGYFVVLPEDIPPDEAENILHALRMVKGVAAVVPSEVDANSQVAREREHGRWLEALIKLVREGPSGLGV